MFLLKMLLGIKKKMNLIEEEFFFYSNLKYSFY